MLGIVVLGVAVGLWTLRRWSFWATLAVAALNFLLSLPGVFEAPPAALRVFIAVSAVVASVLFVLVLLPASRLAPARA